MCVNTLKCLYPLKVSIAFTRRCFVAFSLLFGVVLSSSVFITFCFVNLYHKDLPIDMADKINIIIPKIVNNSVNKKRKRKKGTAHLDMPREYNL